jgi:hypothetical protein
VAAFEGPGAPAEFEYLVREVASALVSVGRGSSYTDAAKRVRLRANRGKTSDEREVVGGQTVAEWMADFVPAVARRHRVEEWPAVLVLDSTRFRWSNWGGETFDLFTVMGAYGYDEDGDHGRLLGFHAAPYGDAGYWAQFLTSVPGMPQVVVCDRDFAIIEAVKRVWNRQVPVHLCEYHMLERGRLALAKDGLGWGSELNTLLHASLQTPEGWEAYATAVEEHPAAENATKWVHHWDARMRVQTERRDSLPPVRSNGAIEDPLSRVRRVIEPRQWTYRNRARMNLLLELMRLAQLRVDNVTSYAADIRAYLKEHNGRPPRAYRAIYDPWGPKDQQKRSYSLWASEAERESRAQRAAANKKSRKKSSQAAVKQAAPTPRRTYSEREPDGLLW